MINLFLVAVSVCAIGLTLGLLVFIVIREIEK
jgi:hypothetical protein